MAWQYLHPDLDERVALGDAVAVTGSEAHHAAVVSRVRRGERIRIASGAGLAVEGLVAAVDRDRVEILVDAVVREPEPRVALWLAQALAKGDRDELAIQAATELGVAGIVPWQAARSVSRWQGDKVRKGLGRWQTVVREAAKQSMRARVPVVAEPVDLAGLAALAADDAMLIVLDPDGDETLPALCAPGSHLDGAERIVLVIGPEGGIEPRELDRLSEAGAIRARLGDTVLRTSTAGPAAIAVVQALIGDWSTAIAPG
ncbi:ribosomal RNA small subunit methyltransferase E [Pseudoclavibacter endophyticus]|uniref:Ribosomal RNA small subunit methyltransferase E n=1 Tax=Pseudoclavibacter endophyticus TaxID=1778590 RepID=A0A6H9WG59_9MICO|nr:16S rRNA (uracil(1498)-N(3))-methyltransferase [Pseudoclavibacter endophyticus]KAB1649939.1 16S rRNA (uracil(1498)-N(3))-methyltransferase [Pseudoclavibacter endophyticus]GGA58573.1 ribosomal RNA small subunit methyltransferase E [Pseudoclavibacter endophyticus]